MKKDEISVENIIQAAVMAAYEVAEKGIEEKLQKAIELGVKIGAVTGAEIGAKSAIQAVEREKKKFRKQAYDRRYHNTKLLLKNYRTLNEHFKNAIFDLEQAEECDDTFADIIEMMNGYGYDEDLYVESIKKSSVKTKIIMTHVNKMLEVYDIMCERSNRADDKRHSRVLNSIYICENPTTATDIAQMENIDKRTVYKDIDAAVSDITALLFGIGGIENL
ncbi:MAG: hypothetical protein RR162_00195 [Oscillospiraceae bacterium]